MKKYLTYFLPFFVAALSVQLQNDEKRWGDTWRQRPREGQEERAFARFQDYLDQWKNAATPVPWLKVAGEALICWVRENYPEELESDAETEVKE